MESGAIERDRKNLLNKISLRLRPPADLASGGAKELFGLGEGAQNLTSAL